MIEVVVIQMCHDLDHILDWLGYDQLEIVLQRSDEEQFHRLVRSGGIGHVDPFFRQLISPKCGIR